MNILTKWVFLALFGNFWGSSDALGSSRDFFIINKKKKKKRKERKRVFIATLSMLLNPKLVNRIRTILLS